MTSGDAGAQRASIARPLRRAIDGAAGIDIANPALGIEAGVAIGHKAICIEGPVHRVQPTIERNVPGARVQSAFARRIEGCIGLANSKGKTDHGLIVRNLIVGTAADAPIDPHRNRRRQSSRSSGWSQNCRASRNPSGR